MKILLIGFGSIGRKHYANLLLLGLNKEDIDVVDTEYHNWMKAKSVDELEPNISETYDLIMICTPSDTHEYFMHYFNSRGAKRIFIEKPLFLPPSYNQQMKGQGLPYRFTDKKSKIYVNYPYRHDPGLIKLKESLHLVGEIKHATLEDSYLFEKCHKYPIEQYEGVLFDDIHIINNSRFLFGDPDNILSSYVSNLFARFDWMVGSAIVSHNTDMLGNNYKKRIEVKGEKGTLIWNFKEHQLWFCPADESERKAISYKKSDHLFEALKHVINNFDDNLDDAIKDMEICEQLCQKQ